MASDEATKSLYQAGSIILGDVPHPPARASFINVFEPKVIRPKGVRPSANDKAVFDLTLFLPLDHPQVAEVRKILATVTGMKWPGRAIEWKDKRLFKSPVSIGDTLADEAKTEGKNNDFYRGMIVIRAHTNVDNPPPLAVSVNGNIVPYTDPARRHEAKKFFVPGCHVAADVSFIPYVGPTGVDGVTCYLNALLWLPGGENLPLGGTRNVVQTFSRFQGQVTATDPTGGAGISQALAALGVGAPPPAEAEPPPF